MNTTFSETPLVLFVDDDASMRLIVGSCLADAKFRVKLVEDGYKAIAFCRKVQPSIILLDIKMPDMDGFTVCREIRRLPECRLIPIVMVTGLDDMDSINKAYDAGATDFVTKPINWVLLVHRIRYILRASQAIQSLQKSEEKHRALLDAIPDLILRVHRSGNVLDIKNSSQDSVPIIPKFILKNTLENILPEPLCSLTQTALERVVRTGTSHVFETECAAKNDARDLECRMVMSGEEEALIMVRDITERKHLEREILQFSQNERFQIGQELHDNLGQQLAGISFMSRVLSTKLAERQIPEAEDAAEIANLVKQAIYQAQAIAKGVMPVDLGENGLAAALENLVTDLQKLYPVQITFRFNWLPQLDPVQATNLYYIAQEAMRNSIQHGEARKITLNIECLPEQITLTVSDDGMGFQESDTGKGMGLRIMRYRAQLLEGELQISNRRGGGTKITCKVPHTSTNCTGTVTHA